MPSPHSLTIYYKLTTTNHCVVVQVMLPLYEHGSDSLMKQFLGNRTRQYH